MVDNETKEPKKGSAQKLREYVKKQLAKARAWWDAAHPKAEKKVTLPKKVANAETPAQK